jgi:hypothetical protein
MDMAATDDLILHLIETGRQASAEEVTAIVAHVAQAPYLLPIAPCLVQSPQLIKPMG